MNKEMNRKLRHKLSILDRYLQERLDNCIERKERWEQRIAEEGNKPLTHRVDDSITYADMIKDAIGNIEHYTKQIEENKELIKELEEM